MNNSEEYFELANKILHSEKVIEGNINLWTTYLDECLKQFVILCNFNFFDIASKFHSFISFPYKYDFSEDEIRRHWAFLHAARVKKITIDEDYYTLIRSRKNLLITIKEKEKEKSLICDENLSNININVNVNNTQEESEEEKEIRLQKEKDRLREERLNQIEEQKFEFQITMNDTNSSLTNLNNYPTDNPTLNRIREKSKDKNLNKNTLNKKKEVYLDPPMHKMENEHDLFIDGLLNAKIDLEQLKHEENVNNKNNKVSNIVSDSQGINNNTQTISNSDTTNNQNLNNYYETDFSFPINSHANEKTSNTNEDLNYDSFNDDDEDNDIPNKNNNNKNTKTNKNNQSNQFSDEIKKTKDMYDYIEENPELRKQAINLEIYSDFTVKSLKHMLPKMMNGQGEADNELKNACLTNNIGNSRVFDTYEEKYIQEASRQINDLILKSKQNESDKEIPVDEIDNYCNNNDTFCNTNEKSINSFSFLNNPHTNDLISNPEFLEKVVGIIQECQFKGIAERNERANKDDKDVGDDRDNNIVDNEKDKSKENNRTNELNNTNTNNLNNKVFEEEEEINTKAKLKQVDENNNKDNSKKNANPEMHLYKGVYCSKPNNADGHNSENSYDSN